MKSLIVLAVVIAAALAAPTEVPLEALVEAPRFLTYGPDGQAVILRYESDNAGIAGYSYGFDTSNGISHAEEGTLENVGTDEQSMVVIGRYSYVGPNGITYEVTYRAGRNGFEPQGAHIPVA